MLSGFNTNFRYRGVLFHVQTEDSGLENPHVITHLFHGGNIMASEKRTYAELLGKEGEDLEERVRKLMEEMHKSMLRQLSRGEHDGDIEARMGADVFLTEAPPPPSEPATVTEEQPPPSETHPHAAEAPSVAEPTVLEPMSGPAGEEHSISRLSKVFGDRVVSEKPLDEVVLDYLVENARKRKRSK